MPDLRQRLTSIIWLTIASTVLWPILGAVPALAFYSAALLLLYIHHLRHLVTLDEWLKTSAPETSTLPNTTGAWGDAFTRLSRLMHSKSQSQQKLSTALERLRHATSAMPEGVVILDESGHIEWCNSVAEQHFSLDFNRDAGQLITHLVRQNQFTEYLVTRNYSEPLIVRQLRQQELTLSLQLIPYGNEQKLLISRDITLLERGETMRRDFVANVSHELRTPLTVIGGFLETLSEEDQTGSKIGKRALTLMTDQTIRMQRLVEDLLTLSRLENAQNPVQEGNVNIVEMLRELYHAAQSLSVGRHHVNLKLDTDAQLRGNADELHSAFSNLISNAIRYTADGGEILLNWQIDNGQGLFLVQDSGIGIESKHLPRLTERFYRIDRSRSRETGGTGLGLAIVKHVLSRHQANLEIVSELGKGSRFIARFPENRLVVTQDNPMPKQY
ncbi:MAG: phosphate regulon sensor histidine kinase PhoR [Nitrosomonadaceae bacterium]|nr:phosphate regulon sensor histidine kinase PhoR [Nitrosospira sp.]MDW7565605.1 phosphate regulon sensor histidine kinase PhoR [Nitrosomonadaceae bacterium]MBI0408775.1 phosphate regulon sensor histidine kinase PhoR [Nitrosospira sp.]MBI0410014.1 phosphate regulon sensor histidine kinase PhoR [Nitrosospira sp.]MBI0412362.1 phosphate regulon sensor histidine kinase PhoR [Nitrosospira sp.]